MTAFRPVSGLKGFYNIQDYGALGNNSTACSTAISATVTACEAAGGGIVYGPPGIYRIASNHTIPASVSLWGAGSAQNPGDAATMFRCTASGAGFTFNGDGGYHQGFMVDGSTGGGTGTAIATTPFTRNGSVSGATFQNIDVRYGAAPYGVLLDTSQNDTWIGFQSHSHAGEGLRITNGAGGHLFSRCEINQNGTHNMQITESVYAGGYTVPTHITFDACIFERNTSTTHSCVRLALCSLIRFVGCGFVHGDETGTYNGPLVSGENAVNQGPIMLEDCFFAGTSNTNGQHAVGVPSLADQWAMRGNFYFSFVQYAIHAPLGHVATSGDWRYGSGVSRYSPGTNVGLDYEINHAAQDVTRPAGTDGAFGATVAGEASGRWQVLTDGTVSWGPGGGAAREITMSRAGSNVLALGVGNMFRTGKGVTGSRPTAVAAGDQWYDTTIAKPIWWNGSVWKDAAGTTV